MGNWLLACSLMTPDISDESLQTQERIYTRTHDQYITKEDASDLFQGGFVAWRCQRGVTIVADGVSPQAEWS